MLTNVTGGTGWILAWRIQLGADGVTESLVMDFEIGVLGGDTSSGHLVGQVIQVSAEVVAFTDGAPANIPTIG
jgi:hypothetical protein